MKSIDFFSRKGCYFKKCQRKKATNQKLMLKRKIIDWQHLCVHNCKCLKMKFIQSWFYNSNQYFGVHPFILLVFKSILLQLLEEENVLKDYYVSGNDTFVPSKIWCRTSGNGLSCMLMIERCIYSFISAMNLSFPFTALQCSVIWGEKRP